MIEQLDLMHGDEPKSTGQRKPRKAAASRRTKRAV
jgi:hypothetical protein